MLQKLKWGSFWLIMRMQMRSAHAKTFFLPFPCFSNIVFPMSSNVNQPINVFFIPGNYDKLKHHVDSLQRLNEGHFDQLWGCRWDLCNAKTEFLLSHCLSNHVFLNIKQCQSIDWFFFYSREGEQTWGGSIAASLIEMKSILINLSWGCMCLTLAFSYK